MSTGAASPRRSRPSATQRLLRSAAAHRRSEATDATLAGVLSFVAGAVNAGGFLAVGQYTSHMTGIVSAIADHLVLGTAGVVGAGIVSILSFIAGAATSAILINWGRRNIRHKQYAYPIALEAFLLLGFGVLGAVGVPANHVLPLALPLLCFIMGLQNATITKMSGARIRTTHLTGMVTDIGVELGKVVYLNRQPRRAAALHVRADRRKLTILCMLVGLFLLGGIVGALGFSRIGYLFCAPLSSLLLLIAYPHLAKGRGAL
jgi:uncharacterized membrane protein YoaK (UPF0700 family)